MKPEETIDFPIRLAWHQISRLYNSKAVKHDITTSIGFALLNIDVRNGTPSTQLGPKMGMEPRSMVRLLRAMEKKGLIERVRDEKDKRIVRMCLTPLGRVKRDITRYSVINFNLAIQEKLPKSKLKHFFDVLNKINLILESDKKFKPNAEKNN